MSVQNFCSGANKLQRRQVALSEVGANRKYSEDEARDGHGQWTSGGDSGDGEGHEGPSHVSGSQKLYDVGEHSVHQVGNKFEVHRGDQVVSHHDDLGEAVGEAYQREEKRNKAVADGLGKARHVPTGRFHTDGAHVEQAHGYGISRSQEGKFLVTEPDVNGDLKVHSSHDNIDDARMAALRRRVQH